MAPGRSAPHCDRPGVKIAVIDSGIEASHPDLAGQVLLNRNFVAGQSARSRTTWHGRGRHHRRQGGQRHRNRRGSARRPPARPARMLAERRAQRVCDTLSLAKAIYFAVDKRADIINLSLSGPEDRLLAELLKTALKRGSASRHRLRPEARRRRISRIHARRDRGLRHIIGTVARRCLHCARTGCADDSAGRTMVSRQWQLFCRSACQRADRFDSGAAAFRITRARLRSASRRHDRRLRHIGEGGGRL